jgi:hypothetical protein
MPERSAPEEGVDVVPLRGTPGRLMLASVPWITSQFPSILVGYNMERLSEIDCLVFTPSIIRVLEPTCQIEGAH